MGTNTEFVFAVELKDNTPQEVIDILNFMASESFKTNNPILETLDKTQLKHKFFSCRNWKYLFTEDSYYFSGSTSVIFRYDDDLECYYLTVRSNLKNYDSEIELFLDWIKPYIAYYKDCIEFLGYYRYEEIDYPTLIYFENGEYVENNSIECHKTNQGEI